MTPRGFEPLMPQILVAGMDWAAGKPGQIERRMGATLIIRDIMPM